MDAKLLHFPRSGKSIAHSAEPALVALAAVLAPMVARELQAMASAAASADDWIDQRSSPLGRRRHNELCRSGVLAGARKVGHAWKVRRSVVDAWIEAHSPAAPAPASPVLAANDQDDGAVDAALARAGLVRTAPVSSLIRPARPARRGR